MKQPSKYNIQVVTLCETGMYDSGVKTVCDEWTMIYSGMLNQSKTRAAHGVAVCLNRTATTAWKNSGVEWNPVSERILRVRIHCSPRSVTLFAVYAPVNPSSKFYTGLEDQEHLTAPRCVGSFTMDVQNANGAKLLDFCILNDSVVTHTFFQHRTIHQASWMHSEKK
jgi:hypothetical protein